ncbi:uncharacterized protein [Arachis hypogaea]|uniref:uncharacterized protein n=1 Tax=Arachis hypogaea TaxID=3818 RepID=UPI003B226068
MINFKKWSRVELGAPIFVWLGAENFLEQEINSAGFFKDHAPHFNDLLLYVEHRYYEKSFTFGSYKESLRNPSTMEYLNSAGSYGGVIVARFCRKYPHIAHGALASSAPILCFDGIVPQHGYYYVVT